MADTVTSSNELKLVYDFTDGDTRTTSLTNPRTGLTMTDINTVSATLQATQAFVGDKDNAPFDKIGSAKYVQTTRRQLDLS